MKGVDVRFGILNILFAAALIIGLVSCEDRQPFRPPDPIDVVLHGTVIDDMGNPLPNVTVTVYEEGRPIGGDNYTFSLVTDNRGEWMDTLSTLSSQTITIVYSRSGLIDLIQSKFVTIGLQEAIDFGSIAIPSLEFEDSYRIVLTWRNIPPDLDAHLTGPKGDGNRFHLYWDNKAGKSADGEEIAKLVSDKRNGFGPETVAIKKLLPGIYRYSVHNYSRNEAPNDTTLATMSNAIVRVFGADGLKYEFSIADEENPVQKEGNTWRVFEIDVAEGTGVATFRLLNQMFDGIAFDDDNVFRIATKPERITIR
jgi:adhesin/invasin